LREAWEWAQAHDLADRNPVAALQGGGAVTVCYVLLVGFLFYLNQLILIFSLFSNFAKSL